ncbi:MAG: hypothetical protein NVSMB33_11980 [Ktedonobacteraceae bacterium]
MDRLSAFAALLVLAIITTLLMFLTALIVHVLGSAAIYFVWLVCIPTECILLLFWLPIMFVTQANVLHSLKLKRADKEHYYQTLREKRRIDLQKRRVQLHLCSRHLSLNVYTPRRLRVRYRPPDDFTENGC